jgi:oxygen-independent coproporphyrinogen-3 oxidase
MTGIYVHLPFCPYICPYCDFAKWPHKRTAAERYLRALHCEIQAETPCFAHSVFLGGGTPNTYAPEDLVGVLQHIDARFSAPSEREVTLEVNPELVREDALCAYRQAGINRLSIGVQSFVPREIEILGRKHTAGDVARVVSAARAAGFENISVDLMFGVPQQTGRSWRSSLERAIELGVEHISAYGLTIEEGTPYERWHAREPNAFPDEGSQADWYEDAMDVLSAAGFEQYEISNFSRPGYQAQHNLNYWANGEYVGLGVGAASYRQGVRSVHTRDLETYVRAALGGQTIPGERECLEGAKRAGEAVMLALRTVRGLSFSRFNGRYGIDFLEFYAPVVERYAQAGLLALDEGHVRLTRRGRLLANDVCAAFVTFQ